jgi:nitric oxide reductase activation protein
MEGNTKKKSASKKDQEAMKSVEQSGSEIVQVGTDVHGESGYYKARSIDCIVVKNLTKALIESNEFPMKSYQREQFSKTSVEKGIVMGTVLGKKLQIRSEVRELKTMRQRTGRIERRLLSELGYGMENVFGHVEISKYKKAMLYISIDASSSMFSGSYTNENSKWHRTMTASVAMAKAASMIDNLDVRIDFRATKGDFPYVVIAYDSTKDNFMKLRTLFPMLSPCGYTPEGLCFEALSKTFVPATSERDVYFVNISDGQPYFQTKGANGFDYAGNDAANHTKRQVDVLRKKGILVSSYYVEDSDSSWYRERFVEAFKRMYGKDAQFINVSNVHEVAKTMNRKFLAKSAN